MNQPGFHGKSEGFFAQLTCLLKLTCSKPPPMSFCPSRWGMFWCKSVLEFLDSALEKPKNRMKIGNFSGGWGSFWLGYSGWWFFSEMFCKQKLGPESFGPPIEGFDSVEQGVWDLQTTGDLRSHDPQGGFDDHRANHQRLGGFFHNFSVAIQDLG